ncbi:MAG: DUF2974 domain-containing protein [Spirochaetales bacterium]|nr:DUF2974 domain-containing protein [Spirochaetales bacterium]MBO6049309.1 DUF2974 domain-containing protein [Spirochaetales bacterium]MBO7348351.1 DUF2974 domain-containing protein [Spirochaetales bacterium]MBP5757142.1 DUF2974 domain-containing protein [Spirochaetales bacterium]
MNNALDYVLWRGDLALSVDGFNEVDMLLFSELVYAPIENYSRSFCSDAGKGPDLLSILKDVYPAPLPKRTSYVFQPRYDLWNMMPTRRRFAEVRLDRFSSNFEPENDKQFAAAIFCCLFGKEKIAVVAYRGTDATVTGWREDFDMAYKSPIPAQSDAVSFLNEALKSGYDKIYVCGHSKGGNLAMYAGAFCSKPEDLSEIYSFDGPGLSDDIIRSDIWKKVSSKIHSYIPESSIIGLLMGHSGTPVIVKSDSKTIMQHNPFYWHVMGGSFVRSEDTTLSSQFLDETLHEFLSDCTLEQKEILVKTTFEIVQVSEAVRVRDIPKGLAMRIPKVKKTISSISKEDREVVGEVLRILAGSGSRTAKLLMEKKVLKS